MKKIGVLTITLMLVLSVVMQASATSVSTTKDYGDVALTGGSMAGHFADVWDLTACDMTLSFTYDANGLVDTAGAGAHAWSQLGVRQIGYGDFNPTWNVEGGGVWLATDYDWTAGTFSPDPAGSPTQDLDDKLILQKAGGHGEGDYNLPSVPPNQWNNHRFWFDRDGVDQWQALSPLAVDGGTYNTNGMYDVVISLQSTGATAGTAYMTINSLNQGFETDGNWNTMELTPAGMTFTGDMSKMQVFYGLYGYGATHNVAFNNIQVTGCLTTYTVTASVTGGHGTVSPGSQTVNYGGSASIAITPDVGYHIETITDNLIAMPIANPYVISNVTENHTVVVTFAPTVPETKDQCKNDGWISVRRADGSTFKNQGDCIQYVNTGK